MNHNLSSSVLSLLFFCLEGEKYEGQYHCIIKGGRCKLFFLFKWLESMI